MFTSKITSILNNNNNIKLILSDICNYTLSDRIFVLNGDLSNCNIIRDPFINDNNGYKIISIFNNEITLDKEYSNTFLSSINSYISNICVNNSYIMSNINSSTFIKDAAIKNTTIGTIFFNDIISSDININMWNGYIDNSIINNGNFGNWYNKKIPAGINLVAINNTYIGKSTTFHNNYINNCNTTDCSFGYVTFNNGTHSSIFKKVTVDNSIVNDGTFNDIIFNYVNMFGGIVGGTGIPVESVVFDNISTPSIININLTDIDDRITTDSSIMLYNYGNQINEFDNYIKNVDINDYSLNLIDISSLDNNTIIANYNSNWKVPINPTILSGNCYITLSNIKSGNIFGGIIKKTIIGNDSTNINLTNTIIMNSFINNCVVANSNIITDNINIPVRFKNSVINSLNDIDYMTLDNCIINKNLYKAEIKNSIINANINTCNTLNCFILNGDYINTYSEDLKVKNINYISGIAPDFLNYGNNIMSPNKVFNTLSTNVNITYSTTPIITLELVELYNDTDGYITPNIDDYLQIKIFDNNNEYITYLKVTESIQNDIIDLNDAASNELIRPIKTINYKWINYNLLNINNSVSVEISLFSDFIPIYPNILNIDLGFLGSDNNLINTSIHDNLNTQIGPFIPVLIVSTDNPYTNSILGSAIKINSININYNQNDSVNIFNSDYPVGAEEIYPDRSKIYVNFNTTQVYYLTNMSGPNLLNITNGNNEHGDPFSLDVNIVLQYKANIGDVYSELTINKNIILA